MARVIRHMGIRVRRAAKRLLRLPLDDSGQAMTEFVIVIPVVLLTFFMAVQTMLIGEAAQFCNLAAFAAARSYATSYAKFQRDANPNPHQRATERARCVAAMNLAPVSLGMNYMWTFGGTADPFATGELNNAMYAARGTAGPPGTPDSLKQQLLEGFAIAFVYRIEGFRITRNGTDRDPRATVDCQFTYRLPLALPGLMSLWSYLHEEEAMRNIADTRLENVAVFGVNNPLADDGLISDPLPLGREFTPVNMLTDFQKVLQSWRTPNNAVLANDLFVAYSQYFIGGGNGPVPANVRIGAKARVGFEPLVGDMP